MTMPITEVARIAHGARSPLALMSNSRARLDQALAEFRASVVELEEQSLAESSWSAPAQPRRDHLRVVQGGRESSKDGDDA